ncbi:AP2 domain-containing protein [Rhizobium rhizogenes]|uniref:AP2 domain-containing protein n=1 Tax=Rhizobium rhizogenes TaxID=359 RepID=UPI000AF84D78|nr:AP2 domain-containing protein [Rhizobium rhizogenes]NTJ22212.1 hypothetical protein [Rhizobium rhizogenes]QUE80931.1 hypothetical protein EML492_03730 [Rhizobium rhizogenes]
MTDQSTKDENDVAVKEGDFYVYAWLRPCGTPFYIGKGKGARADAVHGRNQVFQRIVDKTRRTGGEPRVVRIYESLSETEAFSKERSEIAKYGRLNNKTGILANLTDGGEGSSGYSPTAEARARISAAMTGREITAEHRANLSWALTGLLRSDETKKKIGAVHKGKIISLAHRLQIVEATKFAHPRALFKGVSEVKVSGVWAARIYIDGKGRNLGSFATPEEAACAYDYAAYSAWGSGCYLNFPDIAGSPAPTKRTISDLKRMAPPKDGYKGVSIHKGSKKWRAVIKAGGKPRHLGSFNTPEAAAQSYDKAAYETWGDGCYLNFPELVAPATPANDNQPQAFDLFGATH